MWRCYIGRGQGGWLDHHQTLTQEATVCFLFPTYSQHGITVTVNLEGDPSGPSQLGLLRVLLNLIGSA